MESRHVLAIPHHHSVSQQRLHQLNRNATNPWSAAAFQQQLCRSLCHGVLRKPLRSFSSKRPSLAQELGIVPPPPPKPSKETWAALWERVAKRRVLAKPCSICREGFLQRTQLMLDCGHVFHRACFRQLERVVRREGMSPRCPLCQRADYYVCELPEGPAEAQRLAISKVQALIRGFLCRRRYGFELAKARNPRGAAFVVAALKRLANQYESFASRQEIEVNRVLAAADAAQLRVRLLTMTKNQWQNLRDQALTRLESRQECVVCLHTLGNSGDITLLSCSHCMHEQCAESLEQYAAAAGLRELRCPLCRSTYIRQAL